MTTPHVYKKHIASRWFLEDFTRLHLTASCPTACCSALENISKNNESCVVFICLLNTCLSVWIVEKCSSQDFNSSIQKTSDPLPGLMPQNVATLVVVHGASFWIRWGFQALQGCPLSVASESKNCIQIRMVHEETYLKNDASITNQNKFTNFSGQKNTWNVPQPQMKRNVYNCVWLIFTLTSQAKQWIHPKLLLLHPLQKRGGFISFEATTKQFFARIFPDLLVVSGVALQELTSWPYMEVWDKSSHWICFRIGWRFIIWVSIWFGVLERNNFNMFVKLS